MGGFDRTRRKPSLVRWEAGRAGTVEMVRVGPDPSPGVGAGPHPGILLSTRSG